MTDAHAPPAADIFEPYRARNENALDRWLPAESETPARLHAAMRYAVLGGGKRIRPLLVYTTGAMLGVRPDVLDAPACAVELIHAYSLVHDDLPAMDDDDLRRGRPSCHRAFDEATAILAGDSLQVLAFAILADRPMPGVGASGRLKMVSTLATAAGPGGMAGGQAIDVGAIGSTPSVADLEHMHACKTGALLRACVMLGAYAAPDVGQAELQRLSQFGESIGLAFQIQDDVLDVEGEAEDLGKMPGADAARDKPTYISVAGLDEAKARARQLMRNALAKLEPFGSAAEPLRHLSRYIVDRRY